MQKYFTRKKQFVPRDYTVLKKQQRFFNQSVSKIVRSSSDDNLRESNKKEFLRFYEVHGESTVIKIS